MSDTKTKPFPLQFGHPENFGFVKCQRCGTHRPAQHVEYGPSVADVACADHAWCDAQATRGAQ